MNFGFLASKPEYALFSDACIEAERTFTTSPAMCVVGCRKALELAVKWVYAADEIHEGALSGQPAIAFARTDVPLRRQPHGWSRLPLLVKMGNASVHTTRSCYLKMP